MKHVGYARGEVGVLEEDVPVKLRAWSKKRDVRLEEIYQDEHIGFRLGWTRVGIIKLIELAERERLDADVVWVERAEIHPGIPDAAEILESLGLRVMVIGKDRVPRARSKSLKPERRKPETDEEKQAEVTLRAHQMALGRRKAAHEGRHQGPCPFGYKRLYPSRLMVPEEPGATAVKEVFRLYLKLSSMKRLIGVLADQGSLPRRGSEWSRAGISYVLKNRTYLGEVSYDEIWRPGVHEPLVLRCTFGKVQAMLKRNNKRNRK